MSLYDDTFDDTYKSMYKKQHEKYDKYNLGLSKGIGVVEKLVEICSIEELNALSKKMNDVLKVKGSISSIYDLPEELRMLRYSYYDLNGINTGNIHTKRDYQRMADDIKMAIKLKE